MSLVRIEKGRLRCGMFVESLECEVREFSRRRFLIDSDVLLTQVLAAPAQYAIINSMLSYTSIGAPEKKPATAAAIPEADKAAIRTEFNRLGQELKQVFSSVGKGNVDIDRVAQLSGDLQTLVSDEPASFFLVTRLQDFDEATYQHSVSVAGLMMIAGQQLGLKKDSLQQLGTAGLLHDVGKLLISPELLNKTGQLTPEERSIIRTHPEEGYKLLASTNSVPPIILQIVRHHHELLDGSGYPAKLKGDEINLHVRISVVCDVFEALTSRRAYKKAWSQIEALRWLFDRPHQFDRKICLKVASVI